MHNISCSGSLDPSASNLPPVEAGESRGCDGILVLRTFNLLVGRGEDNLDVARVALVGVDATVRTVCTAASFLSANLNISSPVTIANARPNVREPAERQWP